MKKLSDQIYYTITMMKINWVLVLVLFLIIDLMLCIIFCESASIIILIGVLICAVFVYNC